MGKLHESNDVMQLVASQWAVVPVHIHFRRTLPLEPKSWHLLGLISFLILCRLLGLSESFYDEIKNLPLVSGAPEQSTGFDNDRRGERRPKKQKVRFIFVRRISHHLPKNSNKDKLSCQYSILTKKKLKKKIFCGAFSSYQDMHGYSL